MGATVSKTYELLENLYYYEEEDVVDGPTLDFPNPVLINIFSYMKGGDIGKAATVSKQWSSVLNSNEQLWEGLFLRDFKKEALLRSSGRTWRAAYAAEYQKHVMMFKKNTEEIAKIVGFEGFDSNSTSSYEGLVEFMKSKLDVNVNALQDAGIEA